MKRHTADFLVKVVLVFFISLLSFSLGTYMGKQVSDEQHERETQLRKDLQKVIIEPAPAPEEHKIHFQLVPDEN